MRCLALIAIVSCAAPAAMEPSFVPRSDPSEPVPMSAEDEPPTDAPSRTVPQRFETRRIGAPETTSHEWSGAPVDLDVKDADIHDVIRLLADVGHANVVVADDVSGRVTVKLKHVPWDQALDVVTRAKGLAVERDSGVFLVTGKPLKHDEPTN